MHLQELVRRAAPHLLPALLVFVAIGSGCGGGCQDNRNQNPDPWRPSTPQPECDGWRTACDGECVETRIDTNHCGECGNTCAAGHYCAGGNCVDECEAPFTLCGEECVTLSNTPTHCGECGNTCSTDTSSGYCSVGECRGWTCDEGHADNDGDPSNGCERVCEPTELVDDRREDIELPLVHVDGTVTNEGEPVPADNPGFVLFESLDTESMMYVPVGQDGSFSAVFYAGYYRIHRVEDENCEPAGNCPNDILRNGVHLEQDTTLELGDQAPVVGSTVEVSGRIRVNGDDLPPHPDRASRAVVRFTSPYRQVTMTVGPDGVADFSGDIPIGRYDVRLEGRHCGAHKLPCQPRVMAEGLELREDITFDWELDSVELTGQLTVNGEPLSGPGSRDIYGAVIMDPNEPESGNGRYYFELPEGESGRYRSWVYPGSYEVSVTNQQACGTSALDPAERDIPCTPRVVLDSERIGPGHRMDIDLEVARLTGEVTVNGQTMADSPVNQIRGFLRVFPTDRQPATSLNPLAPNGPARFDIPLYPGEHRVQITRQIVFSEEDWQRERVLPVDTLELDAITIEHSQSVSYDLQIHRLDGDITVDGEPFVPDSGDYAVDIRPRMGLRFGSHRLESGESAEFSTKVYGGQEYSVWLRHDCRGDTSGAAALPCGDKRLRAPFTQTGDDDRTYDLNPTEVTGQLLLDGAPPDEGGDISDLNFRSERAWIRPQVQVDDLGRFELLAYPGTYEVHYLHQPDVCHGSIPCGSRILSTPAVIDDDGTVTLEVPSAQIRGDVTFDGSQGAYPAANGVLVLTTTRQRYRIPVDQGAYGPAAMVDGAYHRVFQQRDESAFGLRETCSYTEGLPCNQYRVDICQ